MQKLSTAATIISYVFSPITLIPLVSVLYLLQQPLSGWQRINSLMIFLGTGVLPVLILLVYLKKIHRISDWDIQKRQERYLFNFIAIGFGIVMLLLLYLFTPHVIRFALVIFMWFTLFSVITLFWKISAHTACITLLYLVLWQWGFFFQVGGLLLVLLVAWARVYRKNHTITQVIGGSMLSLLVYGFASWFKLI